MPRRLRNVLRPAALAVAVLAAAIVVAPVAAGGVKRPKSATYSGHTSQKQQIDLIVSAKRVQYVSFRFECAPGVTGAVGVQDIKLRRTRRGYRFRIAAHGSASFSDDAPEQNVAVSVSGRFARSGRSAKGRARVRSERCGDTGSIRWRVRR